mmetsp:Transcript_17121/g.25335  ORF Transcript_17121/g.25335 Transcript_17121/m.25335 type:complete len:111 (+) Transcript_17121:44-376(+)
MLCSLFRCVLTLSILFFARSFISVFNSKPIAQTSSDKNTLSGLEMAKHVQFKGTKKHRKNRPKKHRLSDINRKKPEFPIEVSSNGRDYPGKPPMYTLLSEGGDDEKPSEA